MCEPKVSKTGKLITLGRGDVLRHHKNNTCSDHNIFRNRNQLEMENTSESENSRFDLTLSLPNFRRHLSSVFFFCCFLNNLLLRKKFIRYKFERLNVKQRRSRWDGSLWAVSSGSMLFAKPYYYRLWQWRSLLYLFITKNENFKIPHAVPPPSQQFYAEFYFHIII